MEVLAIASAGGHWIQLLRLRPAFEGTDVAYMSTKEGFGEMVNGAPFFLIPDANRKDKLALFKSFICVFKIILKNKPRVVITTGAAPGLMGILIGRLLGAKTIWVDSVANVEELSMSGKIASKIASRVYTQWPELVNKRIVYAGNVLS